MIVKVFSVATAIAVIATAAAFATSAKGPEVWFTPGPVIWGASPGNPDPIDNAAAAGDLFKITNNSAFDVEVVITDSSVPPNVARETVRARSIRNILMPAANPPIDTPPYRVEIHSRNGLASGTYEKNPSPFPQ